MKQFLDKVQNGDNLKEEEMIEVMRSIMEGAVPESDLGAFLSALAGRGETVDEITGAARVMREKALTIKAPYDAVDCCGTGGDGAGTYNISTATALVAAACGAPVAKHGNRASSSKSGTADVLELLGVNLEPSPEILEESLKKVRFGFLMAPRHHSAMKHVTDIRKQLGIRTIFNLLGPLANPAGTRYQLIGVYDSKWLRPMAETLQKLGSKRAWVVHGDDGLDEITTTTTTKVCILDDGKISEKTLAPEDFGLPVSDLQALRGGDVTENASALRALLEGQKGAYRDIVMANTAAVLKIHGSVQDLKAGVQKAEQAIDDGLAYEVLRDYIGFSRKDMTA